MIGPVKVNLGVVSTHSRPKAAASHQDLRQKGLQVSTHSRPKAAAYLPAAFFLYHKSFNTQPPEGGCVVILMHYLIYCRFQHTAARRRLRRIKDNVLKVTIVSTHSRPKAAALDSPQL